VVTDLFPQTMQANAGSVRADFKKTPNFGSRKALQHEVQKVFAEELVPSTASWSIGTVGVVDGSGFAKKGTESVGVKRLKD